VLAAGLAGTAAAAAYLDAKYHIRHDLNSGGIETQAAAAQQFIAEREAADQLLMYSVFEAHARANRPNHQFLEFEQRTWTYNAFFADIQRVGNWLLNDLGIKKGEMIALNGPNSPEYLMLWFALDGIGACPALINCNLTGDALQHCVTVSPFKCGHVDDHR
jgi:acyl-coenzyme A synthetase/AMP-(fatty) acid ligase